MPNRWNDIRELLGNVDTRSTNNGWCQSRK